MAPMMVGTSMISLRRLADYLAILNLAGEDTIPAISTNLLSVLLKQRFEESRFRYLRSSERLSSFAIAAGF